MSSNSARNDARGKRILVLGSLNADLVQRVPRLPVAGETLTGGDLQIYAGGKGANQACAAALLGGQVQMAGMLGPDVFSDRLLAELQTAGVDTKSVGKAAASTGTEVSLVLPNAENTIVITPCANAEVTSAFALQAVQELRAGDFLLCQLETPLESVTAAMHAAHARQIVTILDPAPALDLSGELLRATTILTPNQTEAQLLVRSSEPIETTAEAEEAARVLHTRTNQTVIVKLGAQGCVIVTDSRTAHVPSFPVLAVDTTAAGDTFNGALAVALAEGLDLIDASRFANAAGALCVTKPGAIPSIPSRPAVELFLKSATKRT